MSNMAYCRFHNTAQDLSDCEEHLFDDDLSPEEERARLKLIHLCMAIAVDGECFVEEDEQRRAEERDTASRQAGGDLEAQEAEWRRGILSASQGDEHE